MRTIILSASMVKDRSLDQWRKGQTSNMQQTNFSLWSSKWRIQIRISLNIFDSDNDQLKQRQGWNGNGNDGDGIIGLNLFLLFNLVDVTRMARIIFDFFQVVSLAGNIDCLVSDGVCKQHTAPRASFACHTRNLTRVHVAQGSLECSSYESYKSFNLIHDSPHLAWPTVVSTFLYTVSYTCTWFVYLSFVVVSFDPSIQCHSARRVMLWPTGWTIPSHWE